MGSNSQAEAQAAAARETARQFDALSEQVSNVVYDDEAVLENLRLASEQVPELVGLYEAVQQDPSALEEIKTNPQYAAIQEGNLEALQEMADGSGFSEADLAQRREIQRDTATSEQARQKSILQQMAERGQSGSGAELLARLSSSQNAAQSAAEAGDRLATESAAARKQALEQAANTATNLRSQDYTEQSNLATARDQIAAFNAMNRQNVAGQNLQLQQQQANQASQQQADYYTNAAQAEQQKFSNEMSKIGTQGNLTSNQGQWAQSGVAPETNTLGAIGTLAGAGIGALGGGAQGAAVGAQVGGTLGNLFREGGIKRYNNGGTALTSSQIEGRKAEQEQANVEKYGSRYNAAMYGNTDPISREDRIATAKRNLGLDEVLSEDLPQKETQKPASESKKSKESGFDFTSILKAIQPALSKSEPSKSNTAPQTIQLDQEVKNMANFTAEDGGIKSLSPEEMRDNLLREIQAFADGGISDNKKGMAYQDGGEGIIIDSGLEMYEGDQLPDRINDGEMVLNVEQQDRLNDDLMELKRLKSKERTDKLLANGEVEINAEQQENLMSVLRGELDVTELPNDRIVKEPSIGNPTGRMAEFMGMLSKKKRR